MTVLLTALPPGSWQALHKYLLRKEKRKEGKERGSCLSFQLEVETVTFGQVSRMTHDNRTYTWKIQSRGGLLQDSATGNTGLNHQTLRLRD